MKNTFFALALAALATAVHAGAPLAVYPVPEYNFGAFAEADGPVSCRFPVVNAGDEPLALISVRATCGCTKPEYTPGAIAPGDTAYIKVSYDPLYRPGRFEKTIYVDTDATPAKAKLKIKGTVIGAPSTIASRYPGEAGPLKLEHGSVLVGDVPDSHSTTLYFKTYNQSDSAIDVAFAYTPAYLRAQISPNPVPAGETAAISLMFDNMAAKGLYGLVTDSLGISVAGAPAVYLPTTAIISEDFDVLSPAEREKAPVAVLESDKIDFGTIDSADHDLTATVTLRNSGQHPLELRRVYSLDPGIGIAASRTSIKPGGKATLTLTVSPTAFRGKVLNAKAIVICNNPAAPTRQIRLVGMVR